MKNNFLKFATFGLCAMVFACATASARVDKSVSCDGAPRWDKFIVNESQTQWVRGKDGNCYHPADVAAADKRFLYGTKEPTELYGKYEGNGDDSRYLYGNPEDSAKIHAMYGSYYQSTAEPSHAKDSNVQKSEPAVVVKKPAAKKPKPAKKASTKPKSVPVEKPKESSEPVPVAPPPVAKPAPIKASAAPAAIKIADSLWDVDVFCTQINPPVKGKMPPGVILMPGAPEKMSCVTH